MNGIGMGARNSTPQTVRIENTQQGLPIHVTPTVVQRLEDAKRELKQDTTKDRDAPTSIASRDCDQCLEHQQQLENLQQELDKQAEELQQLKQEQINDQSVQSFEDIGWTTFQEKEEQQFAKALNRVDALLNHSPAEHISPVDIEHLSDMKEQLIQCYKQNTGRTLNCAEIAKQFQQTVLKEQLHSMLKFFEANPPPTESGE